MVETEFPRFPGGPLLQATITQRGEFRCEDAHWQDYLNFKFSPTNLKGHYTIIEMGMAQEAIAYLGGRIISHPDYSNVGRSDKGVVY